MKYASILPKDYPTLNNQTFTYSIPLHLENEIKIGSKVLVPFGPKRGLRLGYVLNISEKKDESLSVKDIHSIAPSTIELSADKIKFLEFVSLYFFIPLSNIFEIAHLFPKEEKIEKFYLVNISNLTNIGRIKNKDKVIKYLLSHKDGFSETLFKKRFKLKKNSVVLKNLSKKGIVNEKIIIKEINTYETKKEKKISPAIHLLNGLNLEERVQKYLELLKREAFENVLIITPNAYTLEKIKKILSNEKDTLNAKITYGSKFSILNVRDYFDLIIIDDIINSEYKIGKPFDFDLEKVTSIRAIEIGEKVIFGSFIPTMESFQGLRYGRIKHIKERNILLRQEDFETPEIKIVDLRREIREYGYFDIQPTIFKELKNTLKDNRKCLILINRKGYYNLLICKKCGYVVKCPLCLVPLTYHLEKKKLICRYCGYSQEEFYVCPSCGGVSIRYASAGTERFEKVASRLFKGTKVLRIDREVYEKNPKEIPPFQIAIGTTLALSLLDFNEIDKVVLMGVDSLINMPSFDSYEETLYLIARIYEKLLYQRKKKLIIPTFTPHSSIFHTIYEKNNYALKNFYLSELTEREKLNYPPFTDFFQLDLESYTKENLPEKMERFIKKIRKIKTIEIVNTKPILSQSPFGIYRGRVILKSKNILNARLSLGVIIDEIKKEEKINIKVKSLG